MSKKITDSVANKLAYARKALLAQSRDEVNFVGDYFVQYGKMNNVVFSFTDLSQERKFNVLGRFLIVASHEMGRKDHLIGGAGPYFDCSAIVDNVAFGIHSYHGHWTISVTLIPTQKQKPVTLVSFPHHTDELTSEDGWKKVYDAVSELLCTPNWWRCTKDIDFAKLVDSHLNGASSDIEDSN